MLSSKISEFEKKKHNKKTGDDSNSQSFWNCLKWMDSISLSCLNTFDKTLLAFFSLKRHNDISACKVLTQLFSQLIPTYNSEVCVPLLHHILRSWNDSGIIKKTPLKFCKRYFRST